ncbi:MAG: methyltransferase domain-containing protein [Bacteroidota bacterium]|nr:methyltransferase domain-containing protein [Bacteroidota bacterium]
MKKEIIHKHYEQLANNFDRFWKPSEENFNKIVSKIIDLLELRNNDNFLDLGCGTGLFTKAISNKVNLKTVSCVDFSDKMLKNLKQDNKVKTIKADMVDNFVKDEEHNKVLLKESIHHIGFNNDFLNALHRKLINNTKVLIVDLDFDNKTFPFSKKMKNSDIQYQDLLKKQIKEIENKQINIKTEELTITSKLYKNLFVEKIQKRYLSSFSFLTDKEISDEIDFIQNRYKNQENINFNEKYIFYKLSKT